MPTILTKKSDTPGSVPATGNLTNAAGGAELAVNTADKRLFTITSGSAVVEIGTNPSSLTCSDASFTLMKAASASITNLTATSLVLSNLSIASANVTTLTSASATITNLLATTLTVSSVGVFPAGTASAPAITTSGDTNNGIFFPATDVTAITTAGSERLRVDASGNLGLGVTPSAWSTGKVVEIAAAGYGVWNGGGSIYTVANAYYNNGWKYGGTGEASNYFQYNGAHYWNTAPSGTAGNTITFTQAMTLDASGNLGVGTTSPVSTSGYTGITLNNATNGGAISLQRAGTTAWSMAVDSGSVYLDSPGDRAIRIFNNGSERARINSSGYSKFSNSGAYIDSAGLYHEITSNNNVQIINMSNSNASSPVGAIIEYRNAAPNGTGNTFLTCADTGATRATLRSNGGLANYQANDVNLSDQRVKTDIKPVGSYWNKIKALEIVTFKYKDQTHDDNNVGVIAQQVESVAPEFVDVGGFGDAPEGEEPLKTIYTTDMYHAAIKALQEAMARIEQLEAKVAALESK